MSDPSVVDRPGASGDKGTEPPPAIEVRRLSRRFGELYALRDVSLAVAEGKILALLGPNGAGKTTLLRVLTGLVVQSEGEVRVLGKSTGELGSRRYREMFGLVPSGDRSFYLRISGLENLVFFARLNGFLRSAALERSWECLHAVDLTEAAKKPVGLYSHGMQKRLSVARALLNDPMVLFVDEATHDLDPDGARRVQDLVTAAARRGAAVVWATQRLDEIRGFAHLVVLLDHGTVRFTGTVPELMAISEARRYVLQLRNDRVAGPLPLRVANASLAPLATGGGDDRGEGQYLLSLHEGAVFGEAVAALAAAGVQIVACREERSGIENAFLQLTGGGRCE